MDDEPIVILQDLPTSVRAFCYHDDDDNAFVILNARLNREMQKKAYLHELEHIRKGQMYDPDYKEYEG